MELGLRAETILLGVYEDRERLAGRDAHAADHQPFRQKCLYRLDLANARLGLVPLDLEGWLGHVPTSSERVMFHHEGIRLEGLGLLKRHNLRGGHGHVGRPRVPRGAIDRGDAIGIGRVRL